MSIYVFDETTDVYDLVKQPVNNSPADSTTDMGETPSLSVDGYYSLYGISQSDSQFQIDTDTSFGTPVIDVTNGANTSYSVTAGNLSTSTTYYWRARLQDTDGEWSDWSAVTSFTTASDFMDYSTDIGLSTDGGYTAGTITYDATEYAIIVSPKASGEGSSLEWSSDTSTLYGCTDNDDGSANTTEMLNDDTTLNSGTATEFIDSIQTNGINGYNDWYIPAINELQLMYDNMYAPAANLTGTDWDNDGESFENDSYWSSTETDSTYATTLYFYNGSTNTAYVKTVANYVRAVRRLTL